MIINKKKLIYLLNAYFLNILLGKVEIDPVDAGIMALSPLSREEVFSWNSKICKLFLVDIMPDEFYSLWVFCKYLCPTRPEGFYILHFNN